MSNEDANRKVIFAADEAVLKLMELATAAEMILLKDYSYASYAGEKYELAEDFMKSLNGAIRAFRSVDKAKRQEAIADVKKITNAILSLLEEVPIVLEESKRDSNVVQEFSVKYNEMAKLLRSNDSKNVKK